MDLKNCVENNATVIEFKLLGFRTSRPIKPLLYMIFISMYILSLAGNVMIIITITTHRSLHSPMYFFLGNLSFLEVWYLIVLSPTLLGSLLSEGITISSTSCLTQTFFVGVMVTTECGLLSAMSYDRYVAICFPLHYSSMMGTQLCIQLTVTSWVIGCIVGLSVILPLSQLQFSHLSVVDHYFCDLAPLLQAVCTDTTFIEILIIVLAILIFLFPFPAIIFSYTTIIMTIVRIPSAAGRKKAFSTCSSHLVVVITYFGSLIITYCMPNAGHLSSLNKLCSLLYTQATPLLNPIIYTIRNKAIKEVLGSFLKKTF